MGRCWSPGVPREGNLSCMWAVTPQGAAPLCFCPDLPAKARWHLSDSVTQQSSFAQQTFTQESIETKQTSVAETSFAKQPCAKQALPSKKAGIVQDVIAEEAIAKAFPTKDACACPSFAQQPCAERTFIPKKAVIVQDVIAKETVAKETVAKAFPAKDATAARRPSCNSQPSVTPLAPPAHKPTSPMHTHVKETFLT